MPYDVEDIVDLVLNKDHTGLKSALDDVMASRLEDAIELRKEYVGSQMFNPDSEEDEEDYDSEDDDTDQEEDESNDSE